LSSLFKSGGPDQREATHAAFGSVRQCEVVVAWMRCLTTHVTVYLQSHPAREQGDRENTPPRRFLPSSSLRSKPSALIRRLKNCARNYGTTGILPDSFKSSSSSGAIRVPVKQQRLGEAVDWPRCCGTSGPGAGGVVSFWGLLVVRATSLLFGTLDLLG